jgi:DNA-binding MarR family transcriptional regulator
VSEDVSSDRHRRSRGTGAWAALLQVHAAAVPVLDRELQETVGLPLTWYDVLLELNAAPDRQLQMSDLGEKVVLSRTRVSRLVDEMARAGLVDRQAHPTDGRSTYATITSAGRRRLRTAAPVYLRGIEQHFARHLSDRELKTVEDALRRVQQAGELTSSRRPAE